MSLEELRKSLEQEGKAEAGRITGEAERQAEEILSKAREEAKEIVSGAKARAEAAAQAERNERIGACQLRAKRATSEARNRVIGQALQKIWAEFAEIPKEKAEYERLMKRQISMAENELGKGSTVKVREEDLGLARRIAKNPPKGAEMAGGAIISNTDGTVSIDCSLEAIFAGHEEKLRKLVYHELFGKGKK